MLSIHNNVSGTHFIKLHITFSLPSPSKVQTVLLFVNYGRADGSMTEMSRNGSTVEIMNHLECS